MMPEEFQEYFRPITGAYRGIENGTLDTRRVEECESKWNKEFKVGKFDNLLLEQLEIAQKQDRTKVVIVDIGSGKRGELFRTFLEWKPHGSKTRNFLRENPKMNIEMIGLTDAKKPADFLQEVSIVAESPESQFIDNSQITARNVFYTLSYNQTLEKFIKSQKIDSVDLCLATWSLTYLGEAVFKKVMRDIVKILRPNGGRMVAARYAEEDDFAGSMRLTSLGMLDQRDRMGKKLRFAKQKALELLKKKSKRVAQIKFKDSTILIKKK